MASNTSVDGKPSRVETSPANMARVSTPQAPNQAVTASLSSFEAPSVTPGPSLAAHAVSGHLKDAWDEARAQRGAGTGRQPARPAPAVGRARAAEGGPTRNIANSVAAAGENPDADQVERRQKRRQERLSRRRISRLWLTSHERVKAGRSPVAEPGTRAGDPDWVRPPRAARCGSRINAEGVTIHAGEHGAHLTGTERCSSVWACPTCAPIIRAERALQVQTATNAWAREGGSLVMLTIAGRHKQSDRLRNTLGATYKVLRQVRQSRAWRSLYERYGVIGDIRAVEITDGDNGWHPHIHLLIFVDRAEVTDGDLTEIEDVAYGQFAKRIRRETGHRMNRGVGVNAIRIGPEAASYISKWSEVDQDDRTGHELARADMKKSRGIHGRSPWELLDADVTDQGAFARWVEYFESTLGRRFLEPSRGLYERFGVLDRDDVEIIEDTEAAEAVLDVEAPAYDLMHAEGGTVGYLLDYVEQGDLIAARAMIADYRRRARRLAEKRGQSDRWRDRRRWSPDAPQVTRSEIEPLGGPTPGSGAATDTRVEILAQWRAAKG